MYLLVVKKHIDKISPSNINLQTYYIVTLFITNKKLGDFLEKKLFGGHQQYLNLTHVEQTVLEDIIKFSLELYINAYTTNNFVAFDNTIDFDNIIEDHAQHLFSYGLNMILGGINPDLISILVDNAYEKIMENGINSHIRLQLIFVKYAIKILDLHGIKQYMDFIGQIASYYFYAQINMYNKKLNDNKLI